MIIGGEDFSYYIEYVFGCFVLVGSGNLEKDMEWVYYYGCFNIDEDVMVMGVELYV